MTKLAANQPMTRDRWRESVRAELTAGGVGIELTPSGMTRLTTRHDFMVTTDLANITSRDIKRLLHRSQ